jgi:Tol biopolymer transport system component
VIELKNAGSPALSPDGRHIAFSVETTDGQENRYDSEIGLSRDGRPAFQLTQTADGSSGNYKWSPDGRWLAFTADRGDKNQLYLISPEGGEARRLTDIDEGAGNYEWSPDGTQIALTITEPEAEDLKAREKRYGAFEVDDAEYRMTHRWLIDVDPAAKPDPQRLTEGDAFTVGSFDWSPDGTRIAFDHRPDPLINSSVYTDLSVLDVDTRTIRPLVQQPGYDGGPMWSPDGAWVLFNTATGGSA